MKNKGLLKLPETWFVRVTDENKDVLSQWSFDSDSTLHDGFITGMYKWESGNITKEWAVWGEDDTNCFGQEITFADFKRLVLGEKNHEDYGVLGCEELSMYFEYNNIEDFEGRIKYNIYFLLSEWDYEDFENSKRQSLPLTEYLKLIEPTMEKKYEYKLKDEKFNSAISILINNDYTGKNLYTDKDRIAISNLEATNTLDLFFDKVEVRFTSMTTTLKGKLTIQLHPTSQVKALESNGWKIATEEHINQIREYLRK